jgi:geranylgeranyl pyrophosphate synthase
MNDPFYYLYNNKGKEIRQKFAQKCFDYFEVPEKYNEIIPLFEKIHCFSLIIDDIQNKSTKKRNKDCVHIKYGIPWTIASSLSIYMNIITFISNNFDKKILSIVLNNLNNAFKAQLKEIYYRDKNSKKCITYNEYIEIISGKTSALFKMIIEISYFLGKNKTENIKDITSIIIDYGILFQIKDDYNNLTNTKKEFAKDLDEKKYSYIIVKFFEKNPNDKVFQELFYKDDKTILEKKKIINILKYEINECNNYINQLKKQIKDKIKNKILFFDLFFDLFLEE